MNVSQLRVSILHMFEFVFLLLFQPHRGIHGLPPHCSSLARCNMPVRDRNASHTHTHTERHPSDEVRKQLWRLSPAPSPLPFIPSGAGEIFSFLPLLVLFPPSLHWRDTAFCSSSVWRCVSPFTFVGGVVFFPSFLWVGCCFPLHPLGDAAFLPKILVCLMWNFEILQKLSFIHSLEAN